MCSLALRGHDVGLRLREAAVRPTSRDVLTVMVRHDAEWAVDHAVEIARSGCLREPIDVMYPLPDRDAPRALRALVAAKLVTKDRALQYARNLLADQADLLSELESS